MARCVILSACPVSPALAGLLREDDFIIACDAGYRNCAPLHCKPHVIVGDFDTAPCPQQEDDEIVVLPHVKDDTDKEDAAKLAVQKGFDEVLLLGGLGGRRLEHTLANLCTGLGLEKRGVRATLQDERSRITFVMPGETRGCVGCHETPSVAPQPPPNTAAAKLASPSGSSSKRSTTAPARPRVWLRTASRCSRLRSRS